MNFVFLSPLIHLLLLNLCICTEDRSKWADPNDLINFDHASKKMLDRKGEKPDSIPDDDKVSTHCAVPQDCPKCECQEGISCPPCEAPKPFICEQAALPLLRKYTQNLLKHLEGQTPSGKTETYNIHVSLSSDQVKMLEKFVLTREQRHVHDIHDILNNMIERVVATRLGKLERLVENFEHRIGLSIDRIIQFTLLAASASVVLLIEVRLQVAWRRRITQLIVLMFVISVPWTWYDLYKEAEIKQESRATQIQPEDCKGDAGSYWKSLVSLVSLHEDKCLQYYESVMVDPIVKVPPTKAIAVTFVRFFIAPLKDVGSSLSEFMRALLIDLPVTLYIPAMIMVGAFVFIFLVFCFGYSVRLPFYILSIEPSLPMAAPIAASGVQEAVTAANQQTLAQLEQLQARFDSSQLQLVDRLKHLEQVQQLAIEYSQSFDHSGNAGSPPSVPSEPISSQPGQDTSPSNIVPPKFDKGAQSSEGDKVNKGEVKTTKESKGSLDDHCEESGHGDGKNSGAGATAKCTQIGEVDTLLPDGVVETSSSS